MAAGKILKHIMVDMIYRTSNNQITLMDKLLEARTIHGTGQEVLEDVERSPLNYRQLLVKSSILSQLMKNNTSKGEVVGLLLPNTNATVLSFLALESLEA